MRVAAKSFLPPHSRRRKVTKKVLIKLHAIKDTPPAGYYNTWFQQQQEHPPLHDQLQDVTHGPLISIVVPAYNTPQRFLEELIYSIVSQAYLNWELIIVNASSEAKRRQAINKCSEKDRRIKIVEVGNRGISYNTNLGIKAAKGDYIAFADHDDVLEPFALREIALKIINESAELVYTDEDKISDNGEIYFDPHFKPDWSPDLLTHVNYINHFTVVKRTLLHKVGLLDPTKDGAQDYDLILRITDLSPKIAHVPKILYHWRATYGSTAQDFSSKQNVTNAGRLALEEHFERKGISVRIKPKKDQPGFYKIQYQPYKKVDLIITPFASDALLRLYVELLLKHTSLEHLQVELIVPEGVEPRAYKRDVTVKAIESSDDFLKDALSFAHHEVAIIISQIVLPEKEDWLEQLTGPLRQSHVAAIAPVIVRDSSMIEDCGLVLDAIGSLSPLFKNRPAFHNQTFFGNTDWVRNVDALTGAIVATSVKPLLHFLESSTEKSQSQILLRKFTEASTRNGQNNVIYTEVVFENYSIRLKPHCTHRSAFNPNLLPVGSDYELYTPETSAINILTKIAEHEELS